jgi:hypothetical protein
MSRAAFPLSVGLNVFVKTGQDSFIFEVLLGVYWHQIKQQFGVIIYSASDIPIAA